MAIDRGTDHCVAPRSGGDHRMQRTREQYPLTYVLPLVISVAVAAGLLSIVFETPRTRVHPPGERSSLNRTYRMADFDLRSP